MKIVSVVCPSCGEENSIDIEESDAIVCDGCERILNIYNDKGYYKATEV